MYIYNIFLYFFFILLSLSSSHSYTSSRSHTSSITHILRERARVRLVFSILYSNNNIRTLRMYIVFTWSTVFVLTGSPIVNIMQNRRHSSYCKKTQSTPYVCISMVNKSEKINRLFSRGRQTESSIDIFNWFMILFYKFPFFHFSHFCTFSKLTHRYE